MPLNNLTPLSNQFAELHDRRLIRLEGPEAREFLQGLMTQDLSYLTPHQSLYSLFLSPQGKLLYDVFLYEVTGERLLIECHVSQQDEIVAHLKRYCLRRKVTITPVELPSFIYALFGDKIIETIGVEPKRGMTDARDYATLSLDPRLLDMGVRVLVSEDQYSPFFAEMERLNIHKSTLHEYSVHRHRCGVPQPRRDLRQGLSTPYEANLECLNAISYSKGCYIGQEVIARMQGRGKIKRRLLPFTVEGAVLTDIPEKTEVIANNEGVGVVRSFHAETQRGFALFTVTEIAGVLRAAQPLHILDTDVSVTVPAFFPFPKLTELDIEPNSEKDARGGNAATI